MSETDTKDGLPEQIGSTLGYVFFVGLSLLMAWTIVGHPYLGM